MDYTLDVSDQSPPTLDVSDPPTLVMFDSSPCSNIVRRGECLFEHITNKEGDTIICVTSIAESELVFTSANIHTVTGAVKKRRFSICKNGLFEFMFTDEQNKNKNMEFEELLRFLRTLTSATPL